MARSQGVVGREGFRSHTLRRRLSFLILFLCVILGPATLKICLEYIFVLVVLGLIEHRPFKSLGEEFLVHEVAWEVMGVFVTIRISKLFHKLGWSIP